MFFNATTLTAFRLMLDVNSFIVTALFDRLLMAERAGKLCRDESMEGLRFYSNLFLTSEATYEPL